MAITAVLCYQAHNHIRYLLTQDGAAGTSLTIPTGEAGATPNLQTDSLAGPLKRLSKAQGEGYGSFVAVPTGLPQEQARALWLSDTSGANPSIAGNTQLPLAKCSITPRTGAAAAWIVDGATALAGGGITVDAQAGAGVAYLDIQVPGTIGV